MNSITMLACALCCGLLGSTVDARAACDPPACPKGSKLTEEQGPDGRRHQKCLEPDGDRHGPYQICRDGQVEERSQWRYNQAVGTTSIFEKGRPISKRYYSRRQEVLTCTLESGKENCGITGLHWYCGGPAFRRGRVHTVSSVKALADRMGCPFPKPYERERIDWQRYRVALLRLAIPKPPKHLVFHPQVRLIRVKKRATLMVEWQAECANTSAEPNPDEEKSNPARELRVAIEIPRAVKRVGFKTRQVMPDFEPKTCLSLPSSRPEPDKPTAD